MTVMTAGGRFICLGLLAALSSGPATAGIRVPLLSRPPQVEHRTYALGEWRLRIDTERFSGERRCHLEDRRHHVTYTAGALGFRFGRRTNTLDAWVRIDGGAPTRWQDDLPELTRLGVPMDGASLDNPTDATVWIPARQLDAANYISIQPGEGRAPVTFHLHGFAALRDSARNLGCTPEQRFVR